MSFLVLVLVVWLEKFSAWRQRVQRDGWLRGELNRLERRYPVHPVMVLLVLVGAPVALLALLLHVLQPVAYGLLALPIHLLVLLYSLGRGDAKAALGPFRDAWRRGDDEAALRAAERDLNVSGTDAPDVLALVQGRLLGQVYQGFFAVIFWYAVLGPAAALAYRLLALVAEHSRVQAVQQLAERLLQGLDWLPVRLLGASFALVGHFVRVTQAMLPDLLDLQRPASTLLAQWGRVAIDLPADEQAAPGLSQLDGAWDLLLRSAVLWYVGFACLSLLA